MTQLLDPPASVERAPASEEPTTEETAANVEPTLQEDTNHSAQRLRTTMAGVRLSFSWLGIRRSLSREQKSQAAESFDASSEFLAASKKLLDTRAPAYQAVTAIRSQATSLWKALSLPFPETGLRLIRHDDIAQFDQRMAVLRDQLRTAVSELDRNYDELRTAARERLGTLYNTSDYPSSLQEEFAITWEFPAVEPPDYLRRLQPELYQRECQRVSRQFDEAVQLAEQAFFEEFGKLIGRLGERLSGADDGRPKIFRDSAVENLQAFFERFRRLNVGSNEELERLVDVTQGLLRGVQPQQLRNNSSLRGEIASHLGEVEQSLGDLLVDRPRRHLIRQPK